MSFFKKAKAVITRQELAYDGWNKLHSFDVDYTNSKGTIDRLKREVVDHGGAGAILLYDSHRDVVVLVRQFRMGAHFADEQSFVLEIPAGLLDDDQPEEAVRREAMEETGYEVGAAHPFMRIMSSPGALSEVTHLFAARVDVSHKVSDGGGLDDEHEDIEVVEMKLQDAYDLIATGEIIDAKTIIALQWALLNREMLAKL